MSTQISRDEAVQRIFKFTQLRMKYPEFLAINATKILNEEIIDPIQEAYRSAGVSPKIIEQISLSDVKILSDGTLEYEIRSDYEAEKTGFDVAAARELGTNWAFIRPIFALFLTWIENGVRRFSSGHGRKGLPALNIIDRIIQEREIVAQQRLNEETDLFQAKILS